ncbi:MAG: beta-lactamase family protein [Clostridia bacterium]|nr:beta-lactamase family protein [Clostridia bacterium]
MNFEYLTRFLDNTLPMVGVPGSDTVIYVDHKEVYRHQSGFDNLKFRTPVRDNALYLMYSCSKVSTCVAATQLIEKGEIQVNEPLYAYFPEYRHMAVKVPRPDGTFDLVEAKNPITIRHLLSMTAGFNYDLDSPAIQDVKVKTSGKCPTREVVRALADQPLEFEPGTHFRYSLCLDVVGGVVEEASGMRFGEYLKQNVFEPLGMNETGFFKGTEEQKSRLATLYSVNKAADTISEDNPDNLPYRFGTDYESGGAGLISSVHDQILLADALSDFGRGKNGYQVLTKAGVELMRSNQLDETCIHDFWKMGNQMVGYGYGFGVRTQLYPARSGSLSPIGEFGWDGARLSYLAAIPERKIAVFHAEHVGAFHSFVEPRLINLVISSLERD